MKHFVNGIERYIPEQQFKVYYMKLVLTKLWIVSDVDYRANVGQPFVAF